MDVRSWFPSIETIELVLSNHRHEVERWPRVTVIPLAVPSAPQHQAVAPRAWTRKESEIISLLVSEPLINAEEIRIFFQLPSQRARLLVSEARRLRQTAPPARRRTG